MPKVIDHEYQRGEIADAFLRVLAQKGPAAITMRNIAREAGCSPSLPMHYFDGRPALVEFAFTRHARQFLEQLLERAASGARASERLRGAIEFMIQRSSYGGAEWRSAIAMIVKAEQNSMVASINQQSYIDHLQILITLFDELATELSIPIDSEAEAAFLMAVADGLALATATLGKDAKRLGDALNRFLDVHYAFSKLHNVRTVDHA